MEFQYKKSKILTDLILGFLLLFFTIFISILTIHSIVLEWRETEISKIFFAIIIILTFSFLTYVILGTATIRNKYFKQNLKEEIKLDTRNQKILVLNKTESKSTEINFNDIESIELFYSWNTNFISSDLGYTKLNLINKEKPLIITQNDINQNYINKILKNKVIKKKSNFMNRIKL